MTAWMRGIRLDQAAFAARFFGRAADDPVVKHLHSAILGAATATNHENIREASGKVAEAIKVVGVSQWPRFVADAAERVRDPATMAAVEESRKPPEPGRDAIQSVYPVEALLGIGFAGVAGGALAAARALGGTVARQIFPDRSSLSLKASPAKPLEIPKGIAKDPSAASVVDKLSRYLLNPDHPGGEPKAKWFQQALGFTRENSDALAKQMVFDEARSLSDLSLSRNYLKVIPI